MASKNQNVFVNIQEVHDVVCRIPVDQTCMRVCFGMLWTCFGLMRLSVGAEAGDGEGTLR